MTARQWWRPTLLTGSVLLAAGGLIGLLTNHDGASSTLIATGAVLAGAGMAALLASTR